MPISLDRTLAPAAQHVTSVALPEAEIIALPGGGRLHVIRGGAQPVVQIQVVLRAGKWVETAPGLAALTARTVTEGTCQRSASAIADYVAAYGAFLECSASADRATLSLYSLTRHLPALLPLLAELLTEATFPEKEVDNSRERLIQSVRVEREKNAYLATERFTRNLYGASSPYCTEIDLEALRLRSSEELRAFYHQRYTLSGAEVFVCGGVTETEVLQLTELLSKLRPGEPAILQQAPLPQLAPSLDEIQMEKSLQSSIRMGRRWPTPHHAHTHQLALLNMLLGGYFGSRLMKNIREDKGFTYGIYSGIAHREHVSTFSIGTDVGVADTRPTLTEIEREMRRLQAEPVGEAELRTVVNYTVGKFLGDISTIFEQTAKYSFLVLHNLPADYYEQFLRTIQATSPAELQTLAQEYLQPEAMLTVVAGKLGTDH